MLSFLSSEQVRRLMRDQTSAPIIDRMKAHFMLPCKYISVDFQTYLFVDFKHICLWISNILVCGFKDIFLRICEMD